LEEEIKAVIFDMDGVLIDSEHLWRNAMIRGFNEYGMQLSEDDCRKTMGMRISEVIQLWLKRFNKEISIAAALEKRIIALLLELIRMEGVPLPGINELITFCRSRNLRMGLATSSSVELMQAVLEQLKMREIIEVAVSAENLKYAKPHPEVFLKCAEKLEVLPQQCIVIEDSLNGVIAGKAARMRVVAVPDDIHLKSSPETEKQFVLADHRLNNMHEAVELFKKIIP
jgi:mannitol-1-/sugar-/sorbitol-6-/2-deoxyglucose-6-phosphatase